ncbi:MAG TPA: hypothetical protein VMB04_21210 [Mycobacterium sp.]|nr:hypothetical protein [Mycobacterium sp.]
MRRRTRTCESHAHESAHSNEPYDSDKSYESYNPYKPHQSYERYESHDPGGSGQCSVTTSRMR